MLKVKWLYRKSDIIQMAQTKLVIKNEDLIYIGDNEVFPTNHTDKVFADSIYSKCHVYTIKDYDELTQTDLSTTFFTRASFDVQKLTVSPAFSDWE